MDLEFCYETLDLPVNSCDLIALRAAFRAKTLQFHPAIHKEGQRGSAVRSCVEAKNAFDSLLQHILEEKAKLDPQQELTENEVEMLEEDACVRGALLPLLYQQAVEEAPFPFGCLSSGPLREGGLEREREWTIDYSIVQEECCRSLYPVPSTKVFEDKRFGAEFKVFSLVWISSTPECWPVPLSKEDRSTTAFSTPDGHFFQWARVAKRLPHAHGLMQRRVDAAIGGALMGKVCVAVLDRVLVFSEAASDHMVHVKQVTKKLRHMGLMLDPDRSGFGFNWEGAQCLLRGGPLPQKVVPAFVQEGVGNVQAEPQAVGAESEIVPAEAPGLSSSKKKVGFTKNSKTSGKSEEKNNVEVKEEIEQELERIKEEKNKLRRTMKGKKNSCWEVVESPIFMVFSVQIAMAVGYWYMAEYQERTRLG